MAAVELSHLTIGMLDNGAAGLVIDAAIKEAMADVDDRGSDGKPRKVVITLTMGKDGPNVFTEVDAKATIPARRTHATVGKLKQDGMRSQMLFQPDAADNPDQESLPFEGRKAK